MYKFDKWLDEHYPEMREEYKQANTEKSFWDWIKYKYPDVIEKWKIYLELVYG